MLHVLMLLLSFHLQAAVPESNYAQAVARARSLREIEILQREYARMKVAQTACKIELSEHLAPVNCYEAVELEMPGKSPGKTARLHRLDLLCARAANALPSSEPAANAFVSKACARSLQGASDIRRYREEEGAAWSSY